MIENYKCRAFPTTGICGAAMNPSTHHFALCQRSSMLVLGMGEVHPMGKPRVLLNVVDSHFEPGIPERPSI
jgi:hypothetical protein